VPDGPNYADLGISLRSMVDIIYQQAYFPEDWIYIDNNSTDINTQIRTELHDILHPDTDGGKDRCCAVFRIAKTKSNIG
jgi:hypothetical protein